MQDGTAQGGLARQWLLVVSGQEGIAANVE